MTVAEQKKLVEKVLALPQKTRAHLAHLLIRSLDHPEEKLSQKDWDAAWKKELEKRIKDVRSGKVKTMPASQVMAELRAKYG